MSTLQQYIDHVTEEVADLQNELEEMHVEEWKRPPGQLLLYKLDRLVQCLTHAHAFQTAQTAGKGACVQIQRRGMRPALADALVKGVNPIPDA